MKKHTNLWNEIEDHETKSDKVVLGLTILMVIISIVLILWKPDVEAIGEWIFNLYN